MFLNKQKKHFEEKLVGVTKMIWDLEFKRFKTREIREEIRVEFDGNKAKISNLETLIKKEAEQPTISKDEAARLKDQVEILTRDAERYQKQMVALDYEVEGSKPTNDYPDGIQGINQQLEGLRELQGMIKEYIKSL